MLYFDKDFATNGVNGRNHGDQRKHVLDRYTMFNKSQSAQAEMYGNAAAIIPQDVYREFESTTKEIMRAPNLTLLNDLLPLAKALPVGKVEHIYRRVSTGGTVTTTLNGNGGATLDKVDYDYQSSIKVIHETDFGRAWMEMEGQRSEGFDALVDDQADKVRIMQEAIADHIYNGVDVTFKGTTAYGIKTAAGTVDVDLDASGLDVDFSASATTADNIRAGWIALIDQLRITNNVARDITFYVSREIMSNFQRFYSTSDIGFGTILQSLLGIRGVAAIKEDAMLSGNEVVGVVLDSAFIRPLVGMGVSTVPLFRGNPMDDYNFKVWSNVGLEIKTDFAGRSGVLYARNIA